MAGDPLTVYHFGLEIVSYLGPEIHVGTFGVGFLISAHGGALVVDVLFVMIIRNCGTKDPLGFVSQRLLRPRHTGNDVQGTLVTIAPGAFVWR